MSEPASFPIDVWFLPLAVSADEEEGLSKLLAPDEQARAARFVFEPHRSRFTVARGRLRQILAGLVGRAPEDLRFAYGKHGKPVLAGVPGPPHFNLSHSQDFAVLAVAPLEVGIDVECIRPLKEDVANRFFSASEITSLAALPETAQLAAFYRCWTRKEAVIKALGTGLNLPLKSFDVSIAEGDARLLRLEGAPNAPRNWALVHLDPAPNFVGAIACDGGGLRPLVRIVGAAFGSGA